jgi:hypothetical protein
VDVAVPGADVTVRVMLEPPAMTERPAPIALDVLWN